MDKEVHRGPDEEVHRRPDKEVHRGPDEAKQDSPENFEKLEETKAELAEKGNWVVSSRSGGWVARDDNYDNRLHA